MLKDRKRLERTLSQAEAALSAHEEVLTKGGVAEADRRKNATWRKLDATRRDVKRRLGAVAGVEAREAAALQRKAEMAAEVTSESADE
jgi:IS5 family transposase